MKDSALLRARLGRLRKAASDSRLEGVVLVPGPNIRYLSGVNSLLLERPLLMFVPVEGEIQLLSPEFEAGPYRASGLDMNIHAWTDSEGPRIAMRKACERLKGKWGVEGRTPYLYVELLEKSSNLDLEGAEQTLQALREAKDTTEVRLMMKAASILSRSFEEVPALVAEGMTEIDLARRFSDLLYSKGATQVQDLLVQSGERAADPHSLASGKRIRRNEGIVLDIVVSFEGYHTDVTRTLCIGSSKVLEEVYTKVLEAQRRAIAAVGDGVSVGMVDAAARKYLEREGLGRHFTHRTGHGLGLEVHEAPYIVGGGKEKLREHFFFTVEPGVYMPGRLGVRIEDDLTVEGARGAVITDPPKEYGWWK